MTLAELKESFYQHLTQLYPKKEIDSFFFLVNDYLFQKSRLDYTLDPNWPIASEVEDKLDGILQRLEQQEPIQYILGETAFFGLKFIVNDSVLIPRQETEELVDLILRSDIVSNAQETLRILDIGTGSGCIAVTLAHEMKKSEVFAIDVSPMALEMAKINANNNKVVVHFLEHDILSEKSLDFLFPKTGSGSMKFDIIVSNPPYVKEEEKTEMSGNVLNYEPHLALFVPNNDALIFYNAIADFAVNNLSESGWLYFEINQYLGAEMKSLLEIKGFADIELIQDLFGNDRMAKARLK